MEVYVADLSRDDIDRITRVLSRRPDYGIARPLKRWQQRQEQKMQDLPKIALKPKDIFRRSLISLASKINPGTLPVPAILCKCHERFNALLIRKIFILLAAEVTEITDRLRAYPGKNQALAAFITRMDSVNAYWISKELFRQCFGADPHDDRFVKIESLCEACILAAVGGNGRTLADLRAHLVARNHHGKYSRNPSSSKSPGDRKWRTPRLLPIVESWIDHLKPEDAQEVRQWSEQIIADLKQVQPALKHYRRPSRSGRTYRDFQKSYNDLRSNQIPKRGSSTKGKRLADIPLPIPNQQDAAVQRNMGALYKGYDAHKSIFREDSVLGEGQDIPERPFAPTPRPGAPEPGRHSGTNSTEQPRALFVDRFEREMPIAGDNNDPFHYPVQGSEYDDSYEHEFDERDLEAEARSSAKVNDWYASLAMNQTRTNIDEFDRESGLHPAFQMPLRTGVSTYTNHSAVPQPLRVNKESYAGARAGWTKSDLDADENDDDDQYPEPNCDAKTEWTDASVYTMADVSSPVDLSNAPPMPTIPSQYQQYQQSSNDDGIIPTGTPPALTSGSSRSTTPTTRSSSRYSPAPHASHGGNPDQRPRSFRDQSTPSPQHVEVPYYTRPRPPDRPVMGKPSQKYLFEDSDVGSRLSVTNKKYLKEHRGMKEVATEKNPFQYPQTPASRHASPAQQQREEQYHGPPTPRAPSQHYGGDASRSQTGTPVNREFLERQEQMWRESFGEEEGDLTPADSASNITWTKRQSDDVTNLGFFIKKGDV